MQVQPIPVQQEIVLEGPGGVEPPRAVFMFVRAAVRWPGEIHSVA